MKNINIILSLVALVLTGCETSKHLDLKSVDINALPHFKGDNLVEALPAMLKTCKRIQDLGTTRMKTDADGVSGQAIDWQPFCRELRTMSEPSSEKIRHVMTKHLNAYLATSGGDDVGQFTGYYEPLLHGSMRRHGKYTTPLYKFPGARGYIPRSQIVSGALSGKGLELLYVDSAIDAFFLQIQGSGRVQLDDGRLIRIGYDGANKHSYTPIGKTLIEMGELQRGRATMQSIKAWLRANPCRAEQVMSSNQSYVFFKILKGDGPIGAHNVALTPRRTLAVDRQYISLGTLMWLDINHPTESNKRLQQLMVAQDVGGAIKGPLRADFFWGHGRHAEDLAGLMNAQGRYYVLLPK